MGLGALGGGILGDPTGDKLGCHPRINPALREEVSVHSPLKWGCARWLSGDLPPTLPQERRQRQPTSSIAEPSSAKGCFCWQPTKDSSLATVTQPGQHSKPARLRKQRNRRAGWAQTQMERDGRMNGGSDSESGNVNSTGRVHWVLNWPLSTRNGWGIFLGLRQRFLEVCQEWAGCVRQIRVEKTSWSGALAECFPFLLFAGYTN